MSSGLQVDQQAAHDFGRGTGFSFWRWSWARARSISSAPLWVAWQCFWRSTFSPGGLPRPTRKSCASCSTPPNSGPTMIPANEPSSYFGGFGDMIKLSRLFKDYQESGAMNALVNVHTAIDERT